MSRIIIVPCSKLFCLAYVKVFCHVFIEMFDADDNKFKDPLKIIKIINEKKPINKMIRLYIYKILFNKYQLDAFLDKNKKLKYKLEEYVDFKELLKFSDDEEINYGFETLDNENYVRIYEILENEKKTQFKKKIEEEIVIDNNNLHIDNFFIVSSNLILLRLKIKDFENSEIYSNFFKRYVNHYMKKINIQM